MPDDEKFLVVPLGKKSKAITQTVSNDTAMEIMELLADGPLSTSKVAETLGIPLTTAQYNIEKLMEAGLVRIARTKYSEKGREVKLYEAMNRAIVILPGKSGAGAVMEALRRYIILLPVVGAVSIAVEYLFPITQPVLRAMPSGASGTSGKVAGTASQYTFSAVPGPMPCPTPAADGVTSQYALNAAAPSPMPCPMPAAEGAAYQPTLCAVPSPAPAVAPLPTTVPPQPSSWGGGSLADQAGQAVLPYFQHSGVLFFAGCLLVLALLVILEYARYSNRPRLKK